MRAISILRSCLEEFGGIFGLLFSITKLFAELVCKLSPLFSCVDLLALFTGYTVDDISN